MKRSKGLVKVYEVYSYDMKILIGKFICAFDTSFFAIPCISVERCNSKHFRIVRAS